MSMVVTHSHIDGVTQQTWRTEPSFFPSAQRAIGQSDSTRALRHSQSAEDLLFSKTCRP